LTELTLNTPSIVLLALSPLILWRIYSRVRRWVSVCLFPPLVLLLALVARHHPAALAWLGAGLAAGGLLAVYGLRLTRFERTEQGLFYTPNAHLGIALSLLFVGRILYRLIEVYADGVPSGGSDFVRSPITLAIFGTLAGYYVFYAIGLLRWRFRR
jgi:hypothetical protein